MGKRSETEQMRTNFTLFQNKNFVDDSQHLRYTINCRKKLPNSEIKGKNAYTSNIDAVSEPLYLIFSDDTKTLTDTNNLDYLEYEFTNARTFI